jgi:hypothetical protein
LGATFDVWLIISNSYAARGDKAVLKKAEMVFGVKFLLRRELKVGKCYTHPA